jgi:actin-like ATPase involved in cell morphogenesis
MAYTIGIDLGTTHTAAAVRVGDRVDIARLGGRRPEIPSVVFVDTDGTLLIGETAERRGAADPARLAREVKRRIGDPIPVLVGGSPYSAHALTGHLLQQVVQIVSSQQRARPTAVAVTHPANWGPYKRELLEQAARLAEVGNFTLGPEPEAAAVRYAAGQQVRAGEIIAVYDLGGGTFDAAVLRKTEAGFVLLGQPEGIEQLGGVDFDEAVFNYVLGALGDGVSRLAPDDDDATAALARLRRDCQEAKEALSFDTEVMIPVALPGLHTRLRLNRSEFESMITPVLADTLAATRRALRSAGVAPEELTSILLAGGSSRIPVVAQLVGAEFERPVVLDPEPEHSVAIGAALMAGSPPSSVRPLARSSTRTGATMGRVSVPPAVRASLPPTARASASASVPGPPPANGAMSKRAAKRAAKEAARRAAKAARETSAAQAASGPQAGLAGPGLRGSQAHSSPPAGSIAQAASGPQASSIAQAASGAQAGSVARSASGSQADSIARSGSGAQAGITPPARKPLEDADAPPVAGTGPQSTVYRGVVKVPSPVATAVTDAHPRTPTPVARRRGPSVALLLLLGALLLIGVMVALGFYYRP